MQDLITRTCANDGVRSTPPLADRSRRGFLGAGLALGTLATGAAPVLAQPAPAPGQLTCHVLDTYGGRPGGGMRVDLSILEEGVWKQVRSMITVDSGRTPEPLMLGPAMRTGNFMLEFFHGDYFKTRAYLPSPPFFDRVVHFLAVPLMSTRYHITMVAAPWGYTTYRWKE